MADGINLGDIAKDDITGFEGVVTQRSLWLTNCDRITLQPQELKEGRPQEAVAFDVTHCTLVKPGAHKRADLPPAKDNLAISLGDTVRDTITGFEGIIIGRAKFLSTSDRLGIQPKALDKDGQPQKVHWFDASDIALVKKLEPPAPPENRGGPMPNVPRRSDAARG